MSRTHRRDPYFIRVPSVAKIYLFKTSCHLKFGCPSTLLNKDGELEGSRTTARRAEAWREIVLSFRQKRSLRFSLRQRKPPLLIKKSNGPITIGFFSCQKNGYGFQTFFISAKAIEPSNSTV